MRIAAWMAAGALVLVGSAQSIARTEAADLTNCHVNGQTSRVSRARCEAMIRRTLERSNETCRDGYAHDPDIGACEKTNQQIIAERAPLYCAAHTAPYCADYRGRLIRSVARCDEYRNAARVVLLQKQAGTPAQTIYERYPSRGTFELTDDDLRQIVRAAFGMSSAESAGAFAHRMRAQCLKEVVGAAGGSRHR